MNLSGLDWSFFRPLTPGILAVLASGCVGPAKSVEVLGGIENESKRAALPGTRVQVLEGDGRPTVQLIRRDGDPEPAIGFAVFPDGGSKASLLLSTLVRARLQSAGFGPQTMMRSHGLGFTISASFPEAKQLKSFGHAVVLALESPVDAGEMARRFGEAEIVAARSRAVATLVGQCLGELGAEGPEHYAGWLGLLPTKKAAALEKIRIKAQGPGRLGISGVGDHAVIQAISELVDRDWPEGDPIDGSWHATAEVDVADGKGTRELRAGIRLSSAKSALALARQLNAQDHPLRARLAGVEPRANLLPAEVTLRPGGACVALTLDLESAGADPFRRAGGLAGIIDESLRALSEAPPGEDGYAASLLRPESAREAAALAAWTAVRTSNTGKAPRTTLELAVPEAGAEARKGFRDSLSSYRKSLERLTIDSVSQEELGQSQFWALVASPCASAAEPHDQAGQKAMLVSSLAAQFDGSRGVNLIPWVDTRGIGLLAHSELRVNESAEQLAGRVARALATAIQGPPLDGRLTAGIRRDQLERVGNDPGRTLAESVSFGEAAPRFNPWGHEKSVAVISNRDLERARGVFATSELRLATLNNLSEDQGTMAKRTLSEWLAPSRRRTEACNALPVEPAKPGLWSLRSVDTGLATGVHLAVPLHTPREVGQALAYAMNRPKGYLQRALLVPKLAASAQAWFLGDGVEGALIVEVRGVPEQLEHALSQTRSLLEHLSKKPVEADLVALLAKQQTTLSARTARSPRGRIARLWLGGDPQRVTRERLEDALSQLGSANHRIVRVSTRK